MHDLIDLVSGWFSDVHRLDQETLIRLMKLGSKVQKLLELKGKLGAAAGSRKN